MNGEWRKTAARWEVQFKRYISIGLIPYHPNGGFWPEHVSIVCNHYPRRLGARFDLFVGGFVVALLSKHNKLIEQLRNLVNLNGGYLPILMGPLILNAFPVLDSDAPIGF